jgi:AcrR family transcriptional regulator
MSTCMAKDAETIEMVRPARQRVLETAGKLFYRHGFRAIGIDRIIAESDVAKASFYKHFPSKDDLIIAWLDQAEGFGQAWEDKVVEGRNDPLMAVVEAVAVRAVETSCFGCTYQVSAAEFPDEGHPVHVRALAIKQGVVERLADYARRQGVAEPESAARQIFFLIEGLWAASRMFGAKAPVDEALAAARKILS